MSRPRLTFVACLAATGAGGLLVLAGPLDPPAGPVAGTYRTLDEVEPRTAINQTNTPGDADSVFRIAAPGSYYLTGDLVGQAGLTGIEIAASNVSIDLNGFSLIGVAGSDDGIRPHVPGRYTGVVVRNGALRDWGRDGLRQAHRIGIMTGSIVGGRYSGLIVSANAGDGLQCSEGTVTDCVARDNGGVGFLLIGATASGLSAVSNLDGIDAVGSVLRDSVARSNTRHGVTATSGSLVLATLASDNGSDGFGGLRDVHIESCGSFANSDDGIEVVARVLVRGCSVRQNSGNGINSTTGGDNVLDANLIVQHPNAGYRSGISGNTLVRNVASENTPNYLLAFPDTFGAISNGSLDATDGPWNNVEY